MAPATRRRPHAERREQIARTALAIIGTRGLTALTMASLAEAIGVTSGALFRHFATREEILDEAVVQAETRIQATFPDPALPARERLRHLALARVELISSEPGIAWLLRSRQAQLALPPAGVARLRRLVRRSRATIRRALDEAAAAGEVRSDLPTDLLLLVYTATVHALMPQPGRPPPRGAAPQPAHAIEGLLTMLAPAASPTKRS